MRQEIDYVFCALPGQSCQLGYNRQCETSAKHLVDWDWVVSKYSDTNLVFQTDVLIPVVINNKKSSGINSKTIDCLSRICLCYH